MHLVAFHSKWDCIIFLDYIGIYRGGIRQVPWYTMYLRIYNCAVAAVAHPMDCTDLVIGSAIGMRSRIGDYYTRDRSTPQRDDFYGGTESLTGAVGSEMSGVTRILFRKKITGKFSLLIASTCKNPTKIPKTLPIDRARCSAYSTCLVSCRVLFSHFPSS